MTTKIGILGSGNVGQRLGRGFAQHGFSVMVGSRDPTKLTTWKRETAGDVQIGTFPETARFGDVIVLATSGAGTESAIEAAGPENFARKLVLDTTNPLVFAPGAPVGLFVGTSDSLGERVQRRLPEAKVVKCFNSLSHTRMVDPQFHEGSPRMLICGNDEGAKREATELVRALGWPSTLDVGGIEGARWLEALIPLWMRVGERLQTRDHAIAFVR